jgi:hypothetical protein
MNSACRVGLKMHRLKYATVCHEISALDDVCAMQLHFPNCLQGRQPQIADNVSTQMQWLKAAVGLQLRIP